MSIKLPNEAWKVIGVRSPAAMANVQVLSDVVDMSKYRAVLAILLLGDMAAETIDFSLQTDSAQAFNVDVQTLVAATQLAANATNNDNKQIVLQAVVEKMKPGHRFLRARAITGNTAGGPASIILLGEPRYSNEANLVSVLEVKAA
jgi:hypothetical protein